MANELDRVRISAAELRAEASNSLNIAVCAKGESGLSIFRKNAFDCSAQNDRKESQAKTEANEAPSPVKTREHQEPVGAAKPTKKARKPDQEFYQPGNRRSIQGKDCGVGKEKDTPRAQKPGQKAEQDLQLKKGDVKFEGQVVGEKSCKKEQMADKQKKREKADEERAEKKERGNRRRKGGDREREKNDSKKADEVGERGKGERAKTEKERSKRDADNGNTLGKKERRENHRENRSGDKDACSSDTAKDTRTHGTLVVAAEGGGRKQPNAKISTPISKRYSKSDIRRSRHRTYSSSSASSVTSLEGPGLGVDGAGTKWPRVEPRRGEKERVTNNGRGSRSHLQSWTTNEESSAESMDGSEMSDTVDNRRRGKNGWEKARGERNKSGETKGRGRGILHISLERQSGTSSQNTHPQHGRQSVAPRGRGGGILVLPSRCTLSNAPEVGQSRLFGNRGGASSRSRGGRGGGVRRLWDPNNPDQKPALMNSQSQQSPLQQPTYLQSGYGQLHFLDTDDEVVGSPPVPQGEHFRSRQAAMAFYKFQNSDNPYCYPMSPGNQHNTGQYYPYPYHMGPYQMSPTNSMYTGSGVGQFSSGYRGVGYTQSGEGGALTFEEVEQRARGELGRLLRAADAQELQLSNLLSRDRLSAEGLDRMAHLRADLLKLYEQVILTDIEFSDSQNVDQALWKNVFYQVIERFRQLLKDPTHDNVDNIRNILLTLLDEGALFFDSLLQKLQTTFQFRLEDYMDGVAVRARPLRKTVKYALISAQRCMICQGDIARYREQASDTANYGKARSWYLKAQQIAPKNGRPYNQLALLAVYTKRKLDAVYYYMRSLAASNPILTAKESLMSLFEEVKRKTEQLERRRRQEDEGGSRGPAVRGRGRRDDGARVEIWIRPSGPVAAPSSQRGGSESSRDSEQDGELVSLSASELNKRFILSFLHAHGKLFTKVGMESFPGVAGRVLQEFRTLLQHGPALVGSTHMLQIITINMFTIHNNHSQGEERSALHEQSIALGLGMFALLVQRCTELLRDTPTVQIDDAEEGQKGEEMEGMVHVSASSLDLRELLPSIKVWSDWMLGHPDQWNPPPHSLDCCPDVWQCLADLCNVLARVDHEEVPLYKVDTEESEGDEELTVLQLKEDRLLAGFVPLLAAPQEPCYIDRHTDTAIAADCKRVTVLKYFLEALCGQEEPLLAFKGGKYISLAPQDIFICDDVIIEAESSLSASEDEEEAGDSENDIRQLKARRHALASKLAQQQKRKDKIQAVLQIGGQLELEVRPLFLVPDTNGFIDHLAGLKKLLQCGTYIIVVPLIVITELDGLAKGQDNFGGRLGPGAPKTGTAAHFQAVQANARLAVSFLEKGFEAREPCLRALTSRGSQLESIAFRSEDTSRQQGNNDDVILSCCLHYCKDKAKDFMPSERSGTVRLQREVVLLTDDRNLRVKALTRNVPVRDIPAFLSWAKVG
uniref:Telomerase-binding protein EST1A n=1 Tax=Takifugu rubripes TaxID=31033 RepID=H2RL18_TAKRU